MIGDKPVFIFIAILVISLESALCFNISCRCQEDGDKVMSLAVTAPNDLLTDVRNIEANVNLVCAAACTKHEEDKKHVFADLAHPPAVPGRVGKISVYRSKRSINILSTPIGCNCYTSMGQLTEFESLYCCDTEKN